MIWVPWIFPEFTNPHPHKGSPANWNCQFAVATKTSEPRPSGHQSTGRMYFALNGGRRAGASGYFQVVEVLQVEPELGIGVEVARQAQGSIGANATALVHNFTNPGGGNTKFQRQLVDGEAERLHEILPENFAGVDRRQERLSHDALFLMIICDFHFVGVATTPDKADSPLVVDSNRVLPFPVASQRLQLISRR